MKAAPDTRGDLGASLRPGPRATNETAVPVVPGLPPLSSAVRRQRLRPPIRAASAWVTIGGSVLGDLDPALTHGVDDGLRAVVDRQLAQDRAHVVLHRLLANRQRVGDLLVRHSLRDVVENLDLAGGERSED